MTTPKSMDAVTCFTHLTDNVPEWITQINKLSTHAAEKHAEFVAEYTRLLQSSQVERVRSPSLHSLHSSDTRSAEAPKTETPRAGDSSQSPDPLVISPFEAGNKYLYAQARRKRKLTPSVRSGASGPQKFRSKQAVVIYYDSSLQEQLDTLVRNIGAARNNLRKGKMSRSLQKGLQLPNLTRRFPEMYTSSTEDVRLLTKSTASLPVDAKGSLTQKKADDDRVFCSVDKELETAQSLCETAAHQFLRDGDCKVELEGVLTKFQAVLNLAIAILPKFQAEQTEQQSTEGTKPDAEAALHERPLQEFVGAKFTPTLETLLPSVPHLAGSGLAEIEVDDDDGSSIEVDISKFRGTRAMAGTIRT